MGPAPCSRPFWAISFTGAFDFNGNSIVGAVKSGTPLLTALAAVLLGAVLGPSIVEAARATGLHGGMAPTLTYVGLTLVLIWIWSWVHWWGSVDRREALVQLLTELASHAV